MRRLLANGVATQARRHARTSALRVDGGALEPGSCPSSTAPSACGSRSPSALALEAAAAVIDEPVAGVELHQRDAILLLLRSLADEGPPC